jgi:hypothetical protein
MKLNTVSFTFIPRGFSNGTGHFNKAFALVNYSCRPPRFENTTFYNKGAAYNGRKSITEVKIIYEIITGESICKT